MCGVKVRFLNRDEILPRLTNRARELLALKRDVLEVSLFGSLVRGNYAPGSDADIYVLVREDQRRFTDRIPELLKHFSDLGIHVDVFPYTLEEVERMEDEFFFREIQATKILLCSREHEVMEQSDK